MKSLLFLYNTINYKSYQCCGNRREDALNSDYLMGGKVTENFLVALIPMLWTEQ